MNGRIVGVIVGAALIVASVALGVGYADTAQRVEQLQYQSNQLAEAAADNAAAADALADQVRSLGQTPIVDTGQLPDPQQPRRGPGPTQAQIAAAVAAYCTVGRCDPQDPTAAQVLAAVESYCGQDRCRGDAGEDAEPPTQDELDATVAAYCAARNQCAGPRGRDGADGTDGAPGARGEPGGTCPDGQTRRPYTYPDGREGSRCVTPEPAEEPPPDDDDGPIPGG